MMSRLIKTNPEHFTRFFLMSALLVGVIILVILPCFVMADFKLEEGNTAVVPCIANCSGGYCLNTKVYLQLNSTVNGFGNWSDLDYFVGNILLNQSSSNPAVLGTINTSVTVNFTIVGGNYSFNNSLRCNITSDYANSISPVVFVNVTDSLAPNITLLYPPNLAALDPSIVNFTVIASDNRLVNCTLYGNWSGSFVPNQTLPAISGQNVTFGNVTLSYGVYSWNARCIDAANNSGWASSNFTLYIAGDLSVGSSQITFNPAAPVANVNFTISANITNLANISEQNVLVAFYENDPALGGIQLGNRTANFSGLQTITLNLSWATSAPGSHNIFVWIDPLGSIVESNTANNKANNSVLIPIWQFYYGRMNSSVVLYDNSDKALSTWNIINITGNLFVSGTVTTNGINFAYLKELGRNTTGAATSNTANDFEELDALLNISQYAGSINYTYTNNGQPKLTMPFTIFGNPLQNVPVFNSTNNSNFVTGILWDADDSVNSYFDAVDKEDVVFVTSFNFNKTGAYGRYDYEIRVPASLQNYKAGSSTVTFYYELK
jgi:hypothetical protein